MTQENRTESGFENEWAGKGLEAELNAKAAELAQRAHAQGVDLVGPDGLLAGLTNTVLETGLEAEMSEHLDYENTRSDRL